MEPGVSETTVRQMMGLLKGKLQEEASARLFGHQAILEHFEKKRIFCIGPVPLALRSGPQNLGRGFKVKEIK